MNGTSEVSRKPKLEDSSDSPPDCMLYDVKGLSEHRIEFWIFHNSDNLQIHFPNNNDTINMKLSTALTLIVSAMSDANQVR